MTPITTTLNAIRKHSPCGIGKDDTTGFRKLLNHLGKTTSDDEPLRFSTILESNGLDEALWCLRSISPAHDREIRLLACDYAERVLHLFEDKYPDDKRPRAAIETARRFAKGEATQKELEAAGAAAWAAGAAAWAAWAARATRAAAGAAEAAAWASEAAWAAEAAAWASEAAWAADGAAAWAAERKIQAELLVKYFG